MNDLISITAVLMVLVLSGCANLKYIEKAGEMSDQWKNGSFNLVQTTVEIQDVHYRFKTAAPFNGVQRLPECPVAEDNDKFTLPCPLYKGSKEARESRFAESVKEIKIFVESVDAYLQALSTLASDKPLEAIKEKAQKFNAKAKKANELLVEKIGAADREERVNEASRVLLGLASLYTVNQRDREIKKIIKSANPTIITYLENLQEIFKTMGAIVNAKRNSIIISANTYIKSAWGDPSIVTGEPVERRMRLLGDYERAVEVHEKGNLDMVSVSWSEDKQLNAVALTAALSKYLETMLEDVKEGRNLDTTNLKDTIDTFSAISDQLKDFKKSIES